jgi:histidyl-tRNA synthetase
MGFAIGMERLIELLRQETQGEIPAPDLFVAAIGETAAKKAFQWVQELRGSGLWVEMDYAARGLKGQMKRAGRLGTRWVLIVGEDEIAAGKAVLRNMETKDQEDIPLKGLIESLKSKTGLA